MIEDLLYNDNMNAPQYSLKPEYKVWDEENKEHISISMDAGGYGCVCVTQKSCSITDQISMPPQMALLVAEAIKHVAEHLIKESSQ